MLQFFLNPETVEEYAEFHRLPATRAQVRRALQRAFRQFSLTARDVVLTRDRQNNSNYHLLTLNLPPHRRLSNEEERHVTRLLNTYLAWHNNDVQETFRLLWSL
jgi:hypothetical protein